MQKNTKIIIIGIIILFGLMGIIIGNHTSFEDDLNNLKPVPRENKVNLFLHTYTDDGLLIPVIMSVNPDGQLAFKLSSSLPIHVSLLMSENNRTPNILLKSARIPPGKNKKLDRAGVQFIYPVSADQGQIKFCIIHDDNDKALRARLSKINNEWSKIPAYQCKSVIINDSQQQPNS